MKFFGLSFSNISGTTKFLYSAIFISIFGGIIFYGLSQLDNTKKGKTPNKRRSPKKREW